MKQVPVLLLPKRGVNVKKTSVVKSKKKYKYNNINKKTAALLRAY